MITTLRWFAVWRDMHLWEHLGVPTAFLFARVVGQVRSKTILVIPGLGYVDLHRLFHSNNNFGVKCLVVKQRVERAIAKVIGVADAHAQCQ